MNKKFLLSIIVPVYNVEKYLRQCIDSILTQSFRDFELILVNDGSNDSSPEICREYAAKDSRIHLIDQLNGGAASARNAGIMVSTCEYILFIDGDDFIAENSLKKIMDKNSMDGPCDVAFLKEMHVLPNENIISYDVYNKYNYYSKSHDEVLSYLAEHDPLPVCVWGKLIRRTVLTDHDIYFTEGIICEDVDFCIKLYMHAKTYNFIDIKYYYYRLDRAGSVMNINADRKYYDLYSIILRWTILAENEYTAYSGYIHSILAFQYCMLLPMYKKLQKNKRTQQKQDTAALAWLLGCSNDKRVRILNIVHKFFGFHSVVALLYYYNRLKSWKGDRSL